MFELDDTPIDTDLDSFKELWDDVKQFMKEHPNHIIICADDPGSLHDPPRIPRYGWMAFIPIYSFNIEDEQRNEWTIPCSCLKDDPIKEELMTSEGKLKMIWALRPKQDMN